MHEAWLMRDLMHKILDVVAQQGASRVISVTVRLGALSHMDVAHFKQHFDHAATGTVADGAVIYANVETDIQSPTAAGVLLQSVEVA
jgi:hydrogenase nickel incorporation protein HypA/HybF